MDIKITPSHLKGDITLPSSKSCMHRAVICAALANGISKIGVYGNFSDDILATADAMRELGARMEITSENGMKYINISGTENPPSKAEIDCGESGSTLRFLIPVAASLCEEVCFEGRGRLPERPLTPYYNMFKEYVRGEKELPLTVRGGFAADSFSIRGDISSQFITGLMMALPLTKRNNSICVTDGLQSKPYVDITVDIMEKFGVTVKNNNYEKFSVDGSYTPYDYTAEADWSSAAFWLVADALGADVRCSGLNDKTCQGDSLITEILEKCGIKVIAEKTDGEKYPVFSAVAGNIRGITVDVSDIPDMVPALTVLGCFCDGEFKITNAERLKIKESDRLQSISDGLIKMGAKIRVYNDGLCITGVKTLKGGCTVSAYNDHRIAMALSIAASKCEQPVVIKGAECVKKSYPSFFEDYRNSGGVADELNVG